MESNSPDVEFCAYSIPHPSEPKMNVRIQTYGRFATCACLARPLSMGNPSDLTLLDGLAVDALRKGLVDLQDVCDVVADEFWSKRQAFNEEQGIVR